MSGARDTGGAAFPVVRQQSPNGDVIAFDEPGMTLRDYFAGKAMQGLLAQSLGTAYGSDPALAARYAYDVADDMLKARSA